MNRETKRLLQRQGQIDAEGEPVAPDPQKRAAAQGAGRGGAGGTSGGTSSGRPPGGGRSPRGGKVASERQPIWQRIAQFLREVRIELAKVAWPSRPEVVNYTIVVLFTIVLLTAIVYGLDALFATFVNFLFKT